MIGHWSSRQESWVHVPIESKCLFSLASCHTVGHYVLYTVSSYHCSCNGLPPPPISSVETISADIEKTVRQLERKLEEEELQETRQGGATRGRQDAIPEVTEDLGTGEYREYVI